MLPLKSEEEVVADTEVRPKRAKYFNREYSWLLFNQRVLEEAENTRYPLFERLRFLSIFESNLDEFFVIRVSGLIEQVENRVIEPSFDGYTPKAQLRLIAETVHSMRQRAGALWHQELFPALQKEGISIRQWSDLSPNECSALECYFQSEIFPLCTPIMLHPAPSVPFISNRSLNLAIVLEDEPAGTRLARIKIPTIISRLVRIGENLEEYIFLEDLIKNNLKHIFPSVKILGSYRFRVLRDADIEIRELEAGDLLDTVEKTIRLRRFGDPVLLEISSDMPKEVQSFLLEILDLNQSSALQVEGLLGFDVFNEIIDIDHPDLKFKKHQPYRHPYLEGSENLFETIAATDVLLHHPYDSFQPIESFFASAASDPSVIGIKATLYRVGSESPIVESLLDAAEAGKHVAVMVELKARFDESNNLVWARALERAGVHVSYGFPELKTHCKVCLVIRREPGGIRSYVHLGSGNYNPTTSRFYTDFGLFTCDPDITQDALELFNYLTGFSRQSDYRKLLVAPLNLREEIIRRIEREAKNALLDRPARIIFKLNALVDSKIIDALYAASNSGVKIDLIVRGICCLVPGVPDLSENIQVVSIVGRFLEHSRLYYFENNGSPEAFIGSADLMGRNLDRRIETLVPIEKVEYIHHLRDLILESALKDHQNSWKLSSDGRYIRETDSKTGFVFQKYLMDHPSAQLLLKADKRMPHQM